jgi:hypothetical protein
MSEDSYFLKALWLIGDNSRAIKDPIYQSSFFLAKNCNLGMFKISFFLFFFCCLNTILFIYLFFFFCAGWRYIVAFTKVLTMCQIYHTWIHLLPNTLLNAPLIKFLYNKYYRSYIMDYCC